MEAPLADDAVHRALRGRGAASQEEVRRHNLGGLLRLLHEQGATSRSDLRARTGLNRSTVGALTGQLVDAGLVRESAPVGRGGAGRPSIVVAPSGPTYALAVEIAVERLSAARVGLGGVVLQRREVLHQAVAGDPAPTVAQVAALLRELLEPVAAGGAACVGVGVAVCGLVRAEDGAVRLAPNLGWVDVPLRAMLAQAVDGTVDPGLPILVGNEADLGGLAEHVRGAGTGVSDMVYLCGEMGIGGGIVLDGRPLTGAGGYAGELGHMTVDPGGRRCGCGRIGCWETEIGVHAVLRAVGAVPGTPLEDVFAAHAAGDPATTAGLERVGRWLGLGVANLVNLLNPELVLFGGRTRDLLTAVSPVVREVVAGALHAPRAQVRLEPAGLGADSSLLGAAELAFGPLLEDPLEVLATAARRTPRPQRVAVPAARRRVSVPAGGV